MDGVFVAYHNTERMFGFQYVSLEEMDNYLYGKGHENVGERVFNKCVGLMEAIADRAVGLFPGEVSPCIIISFSCLTKRSRSLLSVHSKPRSQAPFSMCGLSPPSGTAKDPSLSKNSW